MSLLEREYTYYDKRYNAYYTARRTLIRVPVKPLIPLVQAMLKRYTRDAVAAQIGVSDRTIRRWLSGEQNYTHVDHADSVCQRNNTTLTEVYGE